MIEPIRTVLCVDDDEDDRELVCVTINNIDPQIKVVHAENGVEAIDYLLKAQIEGDLPCLIIMDINMPQMDGKEALAVIKKNEDLIDLPVVIFSTSNSPIDKLYCTRFGVNLITKPDNVSNLHNEIKGVLHHCGNS
jgi:CheY-like chemotaxis protein